MGIFVAVLPAALYWLACIFHATLLTLQPALAMSRRKTLWAVRLDVGLLLLQVGDPEFGCCTYFITSLNFTGQQHPNSRGAFWTGTPSTGPDVAVGQMGAFGPWESTVCQDIPCKGRPGPFFLSILLIFALIFSLIQLLTTLKPYAMPTGRLIPLDPCVQFKSFTLPTPADR